MNDNFTLNIPLNSTSFGNLSVSLCRSIMELGLKPCIFPIGGQVQLETQKIDNDFNQWLSYCIGTAHKRHKRDSFPTFKLWHLNSNSESFGKKQLLYSFYECSTPTDEEINAVKNNDIVTFSSQYAVDIFKNVNCNNVIKIPLGFDKWNYYKKDKEYFNDGRITFNLLGKVESRKAHAQVIRAWVKKYGNNPKYFLNCALWNHFINPDQQKAIYNQILEGKRYGNVQFFGWFQTNELMNDYLNSADIVLAMSNCEGWGLGEFASWAIGKHCVGLYAHGHKEWMDDENSCLVHPCGLQPAEDGMFFIKGNQWNQGNWFKWDDSEFYQELDKCIERVNKNRINEEGLKLQERFKFSETTKIILEQLEKM